MTKRIAILAVTAAALTFTSVATPSVAEAQATRTPAQIDSSPKGLFALGILGAELGAVIPAAIGADGDDWWAFVVFPAVGFAGGALLGHYVLDNNNRSKASIALLAGSMALVIPSLVLTLHLAAYDPDDDDWVDQESDAAALERRQRARAGMGIVRVGEAGVHGGFPAIGVAGTYTAEEQQRYGVQQQREVHVSLLTGAF